MREELPGRIIHELFCDDEYFQVLLACCKQNPPIPIPINISALPENAIVNPSNELHITNKKTGQKLIITVQSTSLIPESSRVYKDAMERIDIHFGSSDWKLIEKET